MVTIPNQSPGNSLGGPIICRIVGFTCLFGFLTDMIALVLPLGSGAVWRVGLLQQMGDRSIVLLFGLALILYSFWPIQQFRKLVSYACLSVGVLFLLFCILVIRDSLTLQSQAISNIGRQATELQTRVEAGQSDPEISAQATPEEFAEAARQITVQADTLKQNAKTALTKTGIASTSNFIVVGIGLISLGRVGIGPGKPSGQRQPKGQRQRKTS
jgi:hypothetical protein